MSSSRTGAWPLPASRRLSAPPLGSHAPAIKLTAPSVSPLLRLYQAVASVQARATFRPMAADHISNSAYSPEESAHGDGTKQTTHRARPGLKRRSGPGGSGIGVEDGAGGSAASPAGMQHSSRNQTLRSPTSPGAGGHRQRRSAPEAAAPRSSQREAAPADVSGSNQPGAGSRWPSRTSEAAERWRPSSPSEPGIPASGEAPGQRSKPNWEPATRRAGQSTGTGAGGSRTRYQSNQQRGNERDGDTEEAPSRSGRGYPHGSDSRRRGRTGVEPPRQYSEERNGRARSVNAWEEPYEAVVMSDKYPGLHSFAAAVRAEASSWHPSVICAGLNHAVQLHESLERRARWGGGEAVDEARGLLQRTLHALQAALLPHVRTMRSGRYCVNALWVCGKTDNWGTDGRFLWVLLQHLRQTRQGQHHYFLSGAPGQTHGNLWWALSQYDGQLDDVYDERYGETSREASHRMKHNDGKDNDSSGDDRDRAAVAPHSAASAESAAAAAAGLTGPSGPSAAAQSPWAAAWWDLLEASATNVKATPTLDPMSYKPQELANMILGASRLGYSADPRFIGHLLRHFTAHKGPFKPQAVSNVIYSLGELYGTKFGSAAAAASKRKRAAWEAEGSIPDGAMSGPGLQGSEEGDEEEEGEEQGEGRGGTYLPPACAAHMRGLAVLALERVGLEKFSHQELSNMVYGIAQLGFSLPAVSRVSQPTVLAPEPLASPVRVPAGDPSSDPDVELPADCSGALGRFVHVLAHHVEERLREAPGLFDPQSVANILYALAAMEYPHQSLYGTAVDAVLHRNCMERATPQEWAMLFWALAYVRHQPPQELATPWLQALPDWGSRVGYVRAWAIMLQAVACLGLGNEEVMAAMCAFARQHAPAILAAEGITMHGLTNCLWALALLPPGSMGRYAELQGLLVEAVERCRSEQQGAWDAAGLVQLWQAHTEIEAVISDDSISPATATPAAAAATATAAPPTSPHTTRALQPGSGRPAGPGARLAPRTRSRRKGPAVATGDAPVTATAAAPLRRLSPELAAAARDALVRMMDLTTARHKPTRFQLDVTHTAVLLLLHWRMQQVQERQPSEQGQGPEQPRQQQQRFFRGTSRKLAAGGSPSGGSSSSSSSSEEEGDVAGAAAFPAAGGTAMAGLSPYMLRRQLRELSFVGGELPSPSAGGVGVTRVETEWLVESVGLRVDMCLWLSDGRVVVVEADGPSHFYSNDMRARVPRARLRDRQLMRVYGKENVKSLPYFEWDALDPLQAKAVYLTRLLGLVPGVTQMKAV